MVSSALENKAGPGLETTEVDLAEKNKKVGDTAVDLESVKSVGAKVIQLLGPVFNLIGWNKRGRTYNPLASILLTYFDPVILRGYFRRPEVADLPDVMGSDDSEAIHKAFMKKWGAELKKKSPNVVRAILGVAGKDLLISGLWSLLLLPIPFVGPFILYQLLRYVEDDGVEEWEAWIYVALALVGPLVGSVATSQQHIWGFHAGQKIKLIYSNSVFQKAMSIYTGALQEVSSGNIVNLSSQDPMMIFELTPNIHQIWVAPIQITIATVALYLVLGWSSLVGLAIMVLVMPLYALVGMLMFGLKAAQVKLGDERVKLINECVIGMRVIKMFAWEDSFIRKIEAIRNQELVKVFGFQAVGSFFMFLIMLSPLFVTMGAIGTYVLAGNTLTPTTAFVTTALFGVLRMPILQLPMIATQTMVAMVSFKRLQHYLTVRDIPTDNVVDKCQDEKNAVEIDNATFVWGLEKKVKKPSCLAKLFPKKNQKVKEGGSDSGSSSGEPPIALSDINLTAKKGALVAIIGPVGSGKSSLMSALVGEVPKVSGKVCVEGKTAYVPQSAWVVNGTLRDNILFGNVYEEKWYRRVIDACALQADLDILSGGDMAEIGERGINLSGGQKQRISMARAMYSKADVVFLDDPLSAVDNRVGVHMFEKCIRGGMSGATRILVTNQLQYLGSVDYIYVLADGRIHEHGKYDELVKRGVNVGELLHSHDTSDDPNRVEGGASVKAPSKNRKRQLSTTSEGKTDDDERGTGGDGKINTLIDAEDSSVGAVSLKVYIRYLSSAGGLWVGLGVLMIAVVAQLVQDSINMFLAWWTDDAFDLSQKTYVAIYAGWGLTALLFSLIKSCAFVTGGFMASRRLHRRALKRLFRLPVSFFDATPTGRVLNRFSMDTNIIDTAIPMTWEIYVSLLLVVVFIFILISVSIYWLVFPLALVAIIYFVLQHIYTRTAIELQRLEAVNRSPVFSYLSEVLRGTSSVRAYKQQGRFMAAQFAKVNASNNSLLCSKVSMMWLMIRLENLGAFLNVTVSGVVVLTKGQIDPGFVALALTYSTGVIALMGFTVMLKSQVEMQMNNVERVSEYGTLKSEAAPIIKSCRPPAHWPEKGAIEFDNYSLRYRPDLPRVVESMTLRIDGGSRVGIIGRTGAGKSSLANAIFRMVEADEGRILIDGIDVATLGVQDLRSNINIIPQDPTLFSGTVRFNIDPFGNYTDDDIWRALEHVKMKSVVQSLNKQLLAEVAEGGENFSQGQRQLICLARALVCQPKVLIMDEATASVDSETDAIIQEAVRSQFSNTTLLTVAHRLNTVMDYDKLLVMDRGLVVEFDTPANLLRDPKGFLSRLVDAAGERYSAYLRSLVGLESPSKPSKRGFIAGLLNRAGRNAATGLPSAPSTLELSIENVKLKGEK